VEQPTVWISPDGLLWSAGHINDVPGERRRGRVHVETVAGADDGILIVGGSEGIDAAAWFSADGTSWSHVADSDPPVITGPGVQYAADAVRFGEGWLVVGGTAISDSRRHGSVWMWVPRDTDVPVEVTTTMATIPPFADPSLADIYTYYSTIHDLVTALSGFEDTCSEWDILEDYPDPGAHRAACRQAPGDDIVFWLRLGTVPVDALDPERYVAGVQRDFPSDCSAVAVVGANWMGTFDAQYHEVAEALADQAGGVVVAAEGCTTR
jgi:hypothetical protein